MAAVRTPTERALNRVAIVAVLVITLIFLAPIYWIASTAFKPRNLATTVPPTVLFQPEISPFVKLFTKRSQLRTPPTPEEYAADIAKEADKWGALIRKLNLKVE